MRISSGYEIIKLEYLPYSVSCTVLAHTHTHTHTLNAKGHWPMLFSWAPAANDMSTNVPGHVVLREASKWNNRSHLFTLLQEYILLCLCVSERKYDGGLWLCPGHVFYKRPANGTIGLSCLLRCRNTSCYVCVRVCVLSSWSCKEVWWRPLESWLLSG